MGLAGARKRQKISHDPNNTTWARDTTGFGHKILAQQGWTPGSFLGAKGAAQSSHFSAASASHIRVALKDDNLGIGAKRAGETAENFGLGALVDIYGRLNGKDEQKMQKEQQARADIGARLYAEQRYGATRFVQGGFLVGDKIEKDLSLSEADKSTKVRKEQKKDFSLVQTIQPAAKPAGRAAKRAKDEENEKKRLKKEEKRSTKSSDREESKKKKNKSKAPADETESKEERHKRREERREERRLRKLAKRQEEQEPLEDDSEALDELSAGASPQPGSASTSAEIENATISKAKVSTTTPTLSAVGQFGGSRQAVRRRYIQAKKMAGMDPKALREILMARS